MFYSNGDESTIGMSNTSLSVNNGELKAETPNVKKRHRRMKSSNIKNQDCEGMCNIIYYIIYYEYIILYLIYYIKL